MKSIVLPDGFSVGCSRKTSEYRTDITVPHVKKQSFIIYSSLNGGVSRRGIMVMFP